LLAPSFSNSPVEDDLHIGVIMEAFHEVPIEPRVSAGDDKHKSHHDALCSSCRSALPNFADDMREIAGRYAIA